jgi:hypothetical protein
VASQHITYFLLRCLPCVLHPLNEYGGNLAPYPAVLSTAAALPALLSSLTLNQAASVAGQNELASTQVSQRGSLIRFQARMVGSSLYFLPGD